MKKKILSALTVSFLFAGSVLAQTFTFTNAGAIGREGPTQAQVNAEYTATTLDGDVTINTQGIQEWTVPANGTYTITALGGAGYSTGAAYAGGLGASITGDFALTAGTVLKIVVGQQGSQGSGSGGAGGGGSFVYTGSIGAGGLLIAAGGGGGGGHNNGSGGPGSATQTPTDGGGTRSNGGYQGIGLGGNGGQFSSGNAGTWNSAASGGAGWGSDGLTGYRPAGFQTQYASYPGTRFVGGYQGDNVANGNGGFGGGGGCGGNGVSGGGGGGYTGGGGGDCWNNVDHGGGQGGGSFNSGSNQSNVEGGNAGVMGQVVINFSCVPTVLTVDTANLPDLTDECSVSMPVAPTATNDCGSQVSGTTVTSFPITAQGTTTITWNFTDGINSTSQTQTVIIDDVSDPVPDVGALADFYGCTEATPNTPIAFDDCAGPISGTTATAFPITAVGTTTVTWTYDDGNGNTTTQTQDVIVTGGSPANDSCASATLITPGTYAGSTECASPATLGTCGTSDGSGGAVWFKIVGTGDPLEATMCNLGTSYDTKLRVFEGVCGSLNCVTGNDDSNCAIDGLYSYVFWCTEPGVEYFILAHGYGSNEGSFEMTVNEIPAAFGSSSIITCADSVMINGNYYSSNQVVVDTLVANNGCDSIHTTNLTFDTYSLGVVSQTECDSVMLYGNMYYTSQAVYDTILNGSVDGCDTITQVNLTIKNGYTTDIDYSTCASSYFVGGGTQTVDGVYTDTYTAQNGCDSIVNTNLTLNAGYTTYYENAQICNGESIMLGGANQTSSGTYYDTLVSGGACDSVIVTILDVLPTPSTSISVTIADGESYDFAGSTYTISGTYTETYTAANGCDSTSSLVLTVTPADGVETLVMDGISLFPNPTNGVLFIERESSDMIEVQVLDVTGKVISTLNSTDTKIPLDLTSYEKGLYLITLKDQDRMITHRVIRN